ncbi:Glycoside hydrolase family 16 [Fusarium oxysporum f. sp. vasinfectum]|nr:Glycoside hydrolase family 16 [Fusarium oxysporum f. sp. vasinfectum]
MFCTYVRIWLASTSDPMGDICTSRSPRELTHIIFLFFTTWMTIDRMRIICLAIASTAMIRGINASAQYTLSNRIDSSNFFNSFDFFDEDDPTHGFVEYVDSTTAKSQGLARVSGNGIYLGVDYKTENPPNGRKSVRIHSQKSFTHGLFIADITHMPGSIPGVWPAFWMFGPDWPFSGEIDIIEGVNTQTHNGMYLHTGPGCIVNNEGSDQSTLQIGDDCNAPGGCGQITSRSQNYGNGFNSVKGGVYATEWTSEYIAVWFFQRGSVPSDIRTGHPDPTSWGPAAARFNGGDGCHLDDHFKEHRIVFDTTFCGDWAGSPGIWDSNPETAALGDCKTYIASNPSHLREAYWLIKSIEIYQKPRG